MVLAHGAAWWPSSGRLLIDGGCSSWQWHGITSVLQHRAAYLLDSSRNLASISLLGGYLGRLAGSHAYGAVVKY